MRTLNERRQQQRAPEAARLTQRNMQIKEFLSLRTAALGMYWGLRPEAAEHVGAYGCLGCHGKEPGRLKNKEGGPIRPAAAARPAGCDRRGAVDKFIITH